MKKLYDKTGAIFVLDHEIDGTAYVRPMVKVYTQTNYADDYHEEESDEPAKYMLAVERSSLFDEPPLEIVSAEVFAKREELAALKAEAKKELAEISRQRSSAMYELTSAQRQLEEWMKTHKVMIDLGKLLDGKVLYPLTVSENHYHHGRDIPQIPSMTNAAYLSVTSGNFETGKKWSAKRYADDCYRQTFEFFDTEEERTAVIASEFETTLRKFRERPNFDTTSHTSTTTLHYGTLLEWVKTHPFLSIPADIKAMKEASDQEAVERRRAALAAELASISN